MKKNSSSGASLNTKDKPKFGDQSPPASTSGKVELIFDPRDAKKNAVPDIVTSASTETTTTTDTVKTPVDMPTNINNADATTAASTDNNNNNASPIAAATTLQPQVKVTAPFIVANMDKNTVALINLKHYLAYGKPLFDGSDTYNSYIYGVGETKGWVFGRGKFEGFKPSYGFPMRFELYNQAEEAIMAIDLSTFNNQPARDKLNNKLKEIFSKTSGSRYVQCMREWMDGYHAVYQDDNKAREWVQLNQHMMSKALIDVKKETDLLDDTVETKDLLAFNIRADKNKIPSTKDNKIAAFIRGDLRSSILDTYLHHNINPKFESQLSFDGKYNVQKEKPQASDYALAYMTYQSLETLRKPAPLAVISHLFMAQNTHHMINLQANKPQTAVETDLQSMLIKAMLMHRDPALLLEQVKKGLVTVFENSENRKNYNLHASKYATDEKLMESLRLANVPKKLIDALNFFLGNVDCNDCKNNGQAIQAILESSLNISKDLKAMMDENKPKTFDKGLATEFLDNIAAFTQDPKVIHAMNTWLNPEYVPPVNQAEKKNTNTTTTTATTVTTTPVEKVKL